MMRGPTAAAFVVPGWPAPAGVRALLTTRRGGVGEAPYDSFNLATHVGDDPAVVAANRALLRRRLPAEPLWLDQVHGIDVAMAADGATHACADACVAHGRGRGEVCAVLTADCLPVLLCDDMGTVVAAAHAGWRGLAAGVLEATLARMAIAPARIMAWMGPAIGPAAFEVGDEVRAAFLQTDPGAAAAFRAGAASGKCFADLFMLARRRLLRAGVTRVYGGGVCTFDAREQFFSYRREGTTGRFASLIWLDGTRD
ncbi:MAG: peptidoglycan editing factor PgeF [Azoarcus sp.]|jgi:YfiH family protein|nr:peptidoglycan editing factor PgeF [Azoarcus sp.]